MRIHLILLIALCFAFTTSGHLLLKKKKLLIGALIGKKLIKKLAPKALLAGGGLIAGKKLLGLGRLGGGCRTTCCGCRTHSLRKRSVISDVFSNLTTSVFDQVSNGLDSAGVGLRNFGDQLHQGSQMMRNASFTTRLAGVVASDRIRRGSSNLLGRSDNLLGGSSNLLGTSVNLLGGSNNLLGRSANLLGGSGNLLGGSDNLLGSSSNRLGGSNDILGSLTGDLIRVRRAAPPTHFPNSGNMRTVDDLLNQVRLFNAQVCLARVICELGANPDQYQEAGHRFGAQLLKLYNTPGSQPKMYREAYQTGWRKYFQHPRKCERIYKRSDCSFRSEDLIAAGNDALKNVPIPRN